MTENELKHYGVLGMKWGVHRARKNADKAIAARAKGKDKKADKYEAKSKALTSKHQRLSGGRKAFNYSKSESLGKSVVKSYIFGTYGALKYNQARANGKGRGKAALDGVLNAYGNALTGGGLSIVEPRMSNPKRKK